jgi:hypothetical protein
MPKIINDLDFLACNAPEIYTEPSHTVDFLNQYMPNRDVRFNARPANGMEVEYIKCVRRYEWALMMVEAKAEAEQKNRSMNRKKNL